MAIVEHTVEDRIARITLNRPERLNAITLETPAALRAAPTSRCAVT